MPNLEVGTLIIRSQVFFGKQLLGVLMCPKLNAIKIISFCKVLAYKIESPSTPVNLNITITVGCDLFAHFPQFPL